MPRGSFKIGDFLNLFRSPSISTLVELADFLARESAFAAQKCMVDYCQARTGPMWSKLELEPAFQEGLNRARWEAYPLVLSDMFLVAEGVLRPHLGAMPALSLARAMERLYAEALTRYPPPRHRGEGATWDKDLEGFRTRLGRAQLAAPKQIDALGDETGRALHDLAPIHPEHKRHDRAMVAASLKMRLGRSREDMLKRLDYGALMADLAHHYSAL